MNVVSDEHKATLRQWHEELQEKRGLRASLRRSATLNDVCLSEGFHSLMVQTHSLWNTQGKAWRFTALALVAALAAQVKTIDDRQTFAAQLGQKTGDTPVMSRLRFARLSAVKTPDRAAAPAASRDKSAPRLCQSLVAGGRYLSLVS